MKGKNRHGGQSNGRHAGRGTPTGSPSSPMPRALAEAVAQHLRQAVAFHQQGRWAEAEAAYRSVLDSAPHHPDALHLSGVLALQTGRAAQAVGLIRQAIAVAPGAADFHDNLGSAFAALGQHDRAVMAHIDALHRRPDFPQARYNLGNGLAALNRHDQSAAAFMTALALQPGYAKAWFNLGNQLRALHHHQAAAAAFAHCIALEPTMVDAHTNLGDVYSLLGRLEEALDHHRVAVTLTPDDATAHYNLGAALQQFNRLEEAELSYRDALHRNPRHAEAWNNLGSVLRRLARPEQAVQCHRNALIWRPEFLEAYYNLGNALKRTGALTAAQTVFERVLFRNPDMATATHNLGLLSLIHGALRPGWEGYEKRFAAREARPNRQIARPRWGGEPLAGRRLLVWREQGVGDEIMLASCYHDLAGYDGPVTIEAEPRLASLLDRSFPQFTIRAETCRYDGSETIIPPDFDLHIPAGSLPRLLRCRLSDFPPLPQWLIPDPVRQARWRTRVNALGRGLKIGICWRSQLRSAERDTAYIPLDQWGSLLKLPTIQWVNLQYDDCADEIADAEQRFGRRIHRWDDLDLKDDFEATAAMIANLDLVITVATSAGELAAGLGVPVWRVGGGADWSSLGTQCRPWYPTMRVWRPKAGAALPDVLRDLADTLLSLMASQGQGPAPQSRTDDADQILLTGVQHQKQGRFIAAALRYQRVLALDPAHADALHLLGLACHQQGDSRTGERLVRQALAVDNQFDFAANNLGLIRQARKRALPARAAFAHALALNPAFPEGISHLGVNLQQAKRYNDAARWHRRAIRLMPGNPSFLNNLGTALERQGDFDGAERIYRTALSMAPAQIADIPNNIGTMARQRGEAGPAAIWLDRALRIDPNQPLAAWNLGLLELGRGNLAAGWAGYERRFESSVLQPPRLIDLPVWRGEPLNGRRLLIWAEQGVGDELLFGTAMPLLSSWLTGDTETGQGAGTVVLECDARLVSLFSRALPWAEVRPSAGDPGGPEQRYPSDCDVQLPMGSLFPLLHRQLTSFPPVRRPLLAPLPELADKWRQRVSALPPGLRVGIAWKSQVMDAHRRSAYTALTDWLPIITAPGIVPVNLQYGDCQAEIDGLKGRAGSPPPVIHQWGDLNIKDDFENVSALVSNLDLVISMATSAGELAGALGVPAWRVGGPDWTQLGTAVRPWYPSMALWQPHGGESLSDVLGRIGRSLRHGPQGRDHPPG